MISEVQESTVVIRTIGKHLAEENCMHNIREIMQEALDSKSGLVTSQANADDDLDLTIPKVQNHPKLRND